jgi:FlaA1/EpsC-like NDP-sugar epimerase
MMIQLRLSFFQVFTVTSLWVTLLLTLFYNDQPIEIGYLWNIAGISAIAAVLFGVMYNVLWNYFTLKPMWNIVISSTFSITGGMGITFSSR